MIASERDERFGLTPPVIDRLKRFDRYFLDQAKTHNLVARSTLPDRWERHFLDSAQLYPLVPPDAGHLVDIGSGAGFPGLVLAAMGMERGLKVTLIESVGKKARFLRDAAKVMDLTNATVLAERVETVALSSSPDIITARALASLDKLCFFASHLAAGHTRCLFLKGAKAEQEFTEAREHWHISVEGHPSMTSADSTILEISSLSRKSSTEGKS